MLERTRMAAACVHAETRAKTCVTVLVLQMACPWWLVYPGLSFLNMGMHADLMALLINSFGYGDQKYYELIAGNETFSAPDR